MIEGVADDLEALAGQLTASLASLDSALIAFSGGVDSSLVAALAALGVVLAHGR